MTALVAPARLDIGSLPNTATRLGSGRPSPPTEGAHRAAWASYYRGLGMALCAIPAGTKGPTAKGWPEGDEDPAHWEAHPLDGLGVVLDPSRLVSWDLDALPETRELFATLGLDVDTLTAGAVLVRGNPLRLRALFRVPAGLELTLHKLVWPPRDPTKPTDHPDGKAVTIFELRAGPGVQDVLPPTIHPDTHRPYEWVRPPWELDAPLAELPAELIELGSNQKQVIHVISRSPAHQHDNSTVRARRRGE